MIGEIKLDNTSEEGKTFLERSDGMPEVRLLQAIVNKSFSEMFLYWKRKHNGFYKIKQKEVEHRNEVKRDYLYAKQDELFTIKISKNYVRIYDELKKMNKAEINIIKKRMYKFNGKNI